MPTARNKDKLPGDNNNKCSNKTERDADDALIKLALHYVIKVTTMRQVYTAT